MTTTPKLRRSAEETLRNRIENPEPKLLQELLDAGFTSHNLRLSATQCTLPEKGLDDLLETDARTQLIRRSFRDFRRAREAEASRPLRLLDLGALEGGLSLEMARDGWEVVGVEGRRANHRKCQLVADYFGLDHLRFELSDVRDLTVEGVGRFDAVLCCGLLYHLDDPLAFLSRIGELLRPGGVLFLDTHVAPTRDEEVERSEFAASSQPREVHESGLEGRWIAEDPNEAEQAHPWASIGNERSFWPLKNDLLEALRTVGFSWVAELHGAFDIAEELELKRRYSRAYFLARRPDLAGATA